MHNVSTGPKTEAGKARAKLNALKDGSHAKTVSPVLPQENAVELDERINQWISDLNPRNDAERELVIDAAKLAWELDRTKRCETARLAERVRQAQLKADATAARKRSASWAAGSCTTPGQKPCPRPGGPGKTTRPRSSRGLEESAEGCRWLLDRWIGLRVLLDRDSAWTYGDMFRLIRLLGKYPVEAINDPKLNAIFLAWDAVVPGWAERFWKECKQCKPLHDPGFSDFGRWREIADRPADAAAAITVLRDAHGRASGPAGGAAGSARGDRRRRCRRAGRPGVVRQQRRGRAAAAGADGPRPRAAADAGALDEDAEGRE